MLSIHPNQTHTAYSVYLCKQMAVDYAATTLVSYRHSVQLETVLNSLCSSSFLARINVAVEELCMQQSATITLLQLFPCTEPHTHMSLILCCSKSVQCSTSRLIRFPLHFIMAALLLQLQTAANWGCMPVKKTRGSLPR